jgi:hypothetical protein
MKEYKMDLTAVEILEALLYNNSLSLECFEYGIEKRDIELAIEEVKRLQDLVEKSFKEVL